MDPVEFKSKLINSPGFKCSADGCEVSGELVEFDNGGAFCEKHAFAHMRKVRDDKKRKLEQRAERAAKRQKLEQELKQLEEEDRADRASEPPTAASIAAVASAARAAASQRDAPVAAAASSPAADARAADRRVAMARLAGQLDLAHSMDPPMPPERLRALLQYLRDRDAEGVSNVLPPPCHEEDEGKDESTAAERRAWKKKVVTIEFKTLTGKTVTLANVCANDTVRQLKERFESVEGVSVDQQRAIYSGVQLVNKRRLGSYGVGHEAGATYTMHMVLRLRGS